MFGKKKEEKIVLGTLVDGLPAPSNCNVTVKLTPVSLNIMGNNQDFEIDFSKLELIDIKTDVEMEKVISQSAPGMIIGAAAFGVLGAMIGGRVKTKEKRVVSHFLIINYQSESLKTIIIETTNDWYNGAALVDYFRKLKPNSKPIKVEL